MTPVIDEWAGWEPAQQREKVAVPADMIRLGGGALAVAVAMAHVADQGGVSAFMAPHWLGWAYRLIEAGGVLTALMLTAPRSAWLGWAGGVLLGVGPFLGFLASRTVGVPGDPGDVGNWTYWVGNLTLVLEAGLVMVSVGMRRTLRRRPSLPAGCATHQARPQSGAPLRAWEPIRPVILH
jgi:hypothetical protein